ncbi:MAG: hypothetical protein WCS70_06780 [Verrucomicrobiota bacterium]
MTAEEKQLQREQELADLRAIMETPTGRRFVWRFMEDAAMFTPCFTGNSNTFYVLGKKEFALRYFNDVLIACPEMYFLMMREHQNRKAE